jgi:DNA helicase-2/ATP-dependent DNA helicase PcrA
VFDDIRATRKSDFVNNMWRYLAFDPALPGAHLGGGEGRSWRHPRRSIRSSRRCSISPSLITNGCSYCVHSHTAAAKAKGMTDPNSFVSLAGKTLATALQTMRTARPTAPLSTIFRQPARTENWPFDRITTLSRMIRRHRRARPGAARGATARRTISMASTPSSALAVETLDGPVLVLAGAGTGKTRVLTTRIAHILATGRAYPHQILAVTFTNKAAREMKHRIGQLIGEAVEGMPWLGTFHSIGVQLLRRHAELVACKSDFTILDTDDQIRLMKQLIQAEGIDDKRWPARQLAGMIDGWKNKRPRSRRRCPEGDARAFANGKGRKLYIAYQERLKTLNAAISATCCCENDPPVPRQSGRAAGNTTASSTSSSTSTRTPTSRSICGCACSQAPAAGNHSRRAGRRSKTPPRSRRKSAASATTTSRSMAGAARRSTTSCASRRISRRRSSARAQLPLHRPHPRRGLAPHRPQRGPPRQDAVHRPADPDGDKVVVHRRLGFGRGSARRRRGDRAAPAQGHNLNDMAILVRASFQMREFEDRFVTLGLPYRVIGGPRFYERAEIRDALAYFRLVNSARRRPRLRAHRQRAEARPRRRHPQMLHDYARARGVPLLEAAADGRDRRAEAEGARRSARPRHQFRAAGAPSASTSAHRARRDHPRRERLHRDVAEGPLGGSPGRLDNLKELVRSMEEFEIDARLPRTRLAGDGPEQNAELDAVSIMTLHSAKGLEFDTVFLPGWEEGLFPHQRTLDEQRPRRVSRKSAVSPMSASPAPSAAATSGSSRTAASTACGRRPSPPASSTSCRRRMSRSPTSTSRSRSRTPIRRPAGAAPRRTARRRRATTGARAPATPSSASAMARAGRALAHHRRRAGGEIDGTSEPSKFCRSATGSST